MKSAGVDTEKAIVSGVDATQDALASMKAGDLKVTVFQDAAGQGKVRSMRARAPQGSRSRRRSTSFQLVTPANMDQFMKKN
jgi:inositol transport system substrate-binding protein